MQSKDTPQQLIVRFMTEDMWMDYISAVNSVRSTLNPQQERERDLIVSLLCNGDREQVWTFLASGEIQSSTIAAISNRLSWRDGWAELTTILYGGLDDQTAADQTLGWASEYGHTSLVRELLEHCNPNPTYLNSYALRKATERGYWDIVELLEGYYA